ncbi:MAG: hypothetical protein KJZ75_11415 [Hyphomonadaceae bacterium]|nr:hypothetical protein [Hyphomonadaceae bacterium]
MRTAASAIVVTEFETPTVESGLVMVLVRFGADVRTVTMSPMIAHQLAQSIIDKLHVTNITSMATFRRRRARSAAHDVTSA